MKFITENKKRKKIFPNGYSLVEVLVSLVILSLGLLGIVYLMNSNIKSSQNSRNQIIASELAQEGVELVYNLNANSYAAFPTTSNTNYAISYGDVALGAPNQSASAERLYLDSYGFFSHSATSKNTKFLREVDISADSGTGSLVTVTSTVSWNGLSIPAAASCTIANQCVSLTAVLVSNK